MADKSSQQTADALFIFEALQQVTSTVVINAAEIATQTDAKVNTVQKRFSGIKKRYNLNIQTTTTGAITPIAKSKSGGTTKKASPTPTTKKATTSTPTAKAKVAAIYDQLAEDEVEDDGDGGYEFTSDDGNGKSKSKFRSGSKSKSVTAVGNPNKKIKVEAPAQDSEDEDEDGDDSDLVHKLIYTHGNGAMNRETTCPAADDEE